jgi:hypothetical protein
VRDPLADVRRSTAKIDAAIARKPKAERSKTNGHPTQLADAIDSSAAQAAAVEAGPPSGYPAPRAGQEPLPIEDFHAFMPRHLYIHAPTRALWPAASVNARVHWTGKTRPSEILDATQAVDQMSWLPGHPQIVADRVVIEGGVLEKAGARIFNTYTPPEGTGGDPGDVEPYLEHVLIVYPVDADHILDWFAHRVQRPAEKVNHALVLGGVPGIGKDTLLAPVMRAVGEWNTSEVSPSVLLGRFNGHLKCVLLRVSEARDLGEFDRYRFYDHTKALLAAPPDMLRIDEKGLPEYYIPNVVGVVITTNNRESGIYLPRDDRRHYVAWSDLPENDPASAARCASLWRWYQAGGLANVAAYLRTRDLGDFDPKAPPRKTAAFWAIAQANMPHDESELADLLDLMGNPPAVTLRQLAAAADGRQMQTLASALLDKTQSRTTANRLATAGYAFVPNPTARDSGLWNIAGRRVAAYARKDLSIAAQHQAVKELASNAPTW